MQNRGKILIVDDDPGIRCILQEVIEYEGYGVISADHGQMALNLISEENIPDLILLDLMMPVMNGWEFLEHKQKNSKLAAIPTVILSAFDDSTTPEGAVAFHKKPIDIWNIINTIRRYCPQQEEK